MTLLSGAWVGAMTGYLLAVTLIRAVLATLSIWSLDRAAATRRTAGGPPPDPIAVLVAAHNEEATLPPALESLCQQTRPAAQVVVVDDGSTDRTAERVGTQIAAMGCSASLISIPRAGKWTALTVGLRAVAPPLTCLMDADVEMDSNVLERLAERFRDPLTIAVGAWVWPAPPRSGGLVARLLAVGQTAEYARAILWRPGWELLGALAIVEGRCGLVRTDLLRAVELPPTLSAGIDYAITMGVRRAAFARGVAGRVGIEPRAIVWTSVPRTMQTFLAQRSRWARGLRANYAANRDVLFNPAFGAVGMAELPVRLFTSVCPLVELTAWVTCIVLSAAESLWAGAAWTVLSLYVASVSAELWIGLWLGRSLTGQSIAQSFTPFLWFAVPLVAMAWEPLKAAATVASWFGRAERAGAWGVHREEGTARPGARRDLDG